MCICAETMILSRNGFTGSVTNACRIDPSDRERHAGQRRRPGLDQPAVALSTTPHEMSPWFVLTPCTLPSRTSKPGHLDALVDLDAARGPTCFA